MIITIYWYQKCTVLQLSVKSDAVTNETCKSSNKG